MPRNQTHREISAVVGASSAFFHAYMKDQSLPNAILSGLGGYIGGICIASLPDKLDPPTSPNHRGLGHGVLPNAVLISQLEPSSFGTSRWLCDRANELDSHESLAAPLFAAACRIASGLIIGAFVGYVAHLAADAFTTRGLPLVG